MSQYLGNTRQTAVIHSKEVCRIYSGQLYNLTTGNYKKHIFLRVVSRQSIVCMFVLM